MKVDYERCSHCSRPLHRKPCDMCRVSHTAMLSNNAYDEQTLSRISDMIYKAYTDGTKLSLFLTRARA